MSTVERQWAGEVITEPCLLRDMPLTVYHGTPCDGPAMSSSGLRTIAAQSPAHYWVTSPHNVARVEAEQKDELNFGSAAHCLLLGEAGFREKYAVRPEEFSDWRKAAAKQWRDEMIDAGRVIITPGQVEAIRGMAEALAADPLVQAGLLNGRVERSIFWRDAVTGLWLKARPDVLPEGDGMVADYKSTTDASPEAVQRAIVNYGYAMQLALIGEGLKQVAGVEMTDAVLVFQEKAPPFAVNVVIVEQEWIGWASRQLRRAVDTAARCFESGEWPSYPGEKHAFIPDWLRKRFEHHEQIGLLPSYGLGESVPANDQSQA